MSTSHLVLEDLQKAFAKKGANKVIELDPFLIHKETFNLLRLEDVYPMTKGVIPPYRQSDFFLLFVKSGAGKRWIGHYKFDIEDNSLVIVPPRVIHASTYTGKPTGYLITFNADFFLQQAFSYKLLNSKRVLQLSLKPYMVVTDEQASEIVSIFEKIIEECTGGFDGNKQMIALKVLELLILSDRYFTEKDECDCTVDYRETLQRFYELIEANFSERRDVQFYADAMHTHPNNLNLIVKKATGLTAKQTIRNRLIIEAKYLLVSTELSIKEIAYKLGFEDSNYFQTFFRKDQDITPSRYRSQYV